MSFNYVLLGWLCFSGISAHAADASPKDINPNSVAVGNQEGDTPGLKDFSGRAVEGWSTQDVKGFFERPVQTKERERFEYGYDSEHITFFVSNERLEPKIFGPLVCDKARIFVAELQKQIAVKLLSVDQPHVYQTLQGISRHARYICHTCCALQLKALVGQELGTVPAKTTHYFMFPYTSVDAHKFYQACITDFYKNKTYDELSKLKEATK